MTLKHKFSFRDVFGHLNSEISNVTAAVDSIASEIENIHHAKDEVYGNLESLGAVVVIYFLPKSYVIYRKPRKLSDEQREQAKRKEYNVVFVC